MALNTEILKAIEAMLIRTTKGEPHLFVLFHDKTEAAARSLWKAFRYSNVSGTAYEIEPRQEEIENGDYEWLNQTMDQFNEWFLGLDADRKTRLLWGSQFRAKNKVVPKVVCQHCGEEFQPVRSTAKFCKPYCRVAWNREQKRQDKI